MDYQPSRQGSKLSNFGQGKTHQENRYVQRNALIFAILMLVFQIVITVMYGTYGQYQIASTLNLVEFSQVIGLLLLVVVGFGLIFSYNKKLVWSGMGFTLFITAFVIEFYPLMNDFWSRANFFNATKNFQENNNFVLTIQTLINAIKCALSISIAFSFILGRAGPLQCWFLCIFGTIGFQINRLIINGVGFDPLGTSYVFMYGGSLGLLSSVILNFRERGEQYETYGHRYYTAVRFSASMALLGSCFICSLFPILTLNAQTLIITNATPSAIFTSRLSNIMSIGASTITAISLSMAINGDLNPRDIIYGSVAGAICCLQASIFIANPVFAILTGIVAGVVQTVSQTAQKVYINRKNRVIATISVTLFVIQPFVGQAFAAIWQAATGTNSYGLNYTLNTIEGAQYQWFLVLISMALGIGFGIICGILITLVNGQKRDDYFTDRTYWFDEDGISYGISDEQTAYQQQKIAGSIIYQGVQIKNTHSYL